MKVQIAVIGGGIAIAAAVAYAEFKSQPATSNLPSPQSSLQTFSPKPSQNSQTKTSPTLKSQAKPKQIIPNPNVRPQIPNGGGGGEGGEREGGFFGGEDD